MHFIHQFLNFTTDQYFISIQSSECLGSNQLLFNFHTKNKQLLNHLLYIIKQRKVLTEVFYLNPLYQNSIYP
jgi:hypothetical protein